MGRKAKKAAPKKGSKVSTVEGKDAVKLSFAETILTFRHESISVQVSRELAEGSHLLVELQDQSTSTEEIPISLSIETVQAWVEVLQAKQTDTLSSLGTSKLLGALEGADFLRDDDTVAVCVNALCRAFMPPGASTNDPASESKAQDVKAPFPMGPTAMALAASGAQGPEPPEPPTQAQREQAFEVMRAAPARTIPRILTSIHPRPLSTARLERATQVSDAAALRHLLMLLPPTFHPAVLHARYPTIQNDRALFVPDVSPFSYSRTPAPEQASLTLHALAAAAVFAAGSPAAAWSTAKEVPKPKKDPLRQLSHAPVPLALLRGELKRARSTEDAGGADDDSAAEAAAAAAAALALPDVTEEIVPAAAMAPAAALTRLSLHLGNDAERSCTGLRALGTLCELKLFVSSVWDLDVKGFAAAMCALPALGRLHIKAESPEHIDYTIDTDVRDLLGVVTALPRLHALGLESVFYTNHMFKRRRDPLGPNLIDQLSRLTGLTYLSLRDNLVRRKDAGVKLGKGLRRLKKLKQLCIANIQEGVEYVLQIYVNGGFPALQALDTGNCHLNRFARSAPAFESSPVGARLTALGLSCGSSGPSDSTNGLFAGERFTVLPKGFPALQVLDLRRNWMHDQGLDGVAAVLPQLTAMHSLDVGHNGVTHESLFALLAAAVKLGKGKSRGLRRLGIAGAAVGPEHAAALAGLLTPLTLLEEVDVSGLGLGGAGVRGVVEALPRLYGLNVSDNGQAAEDIEAVVPLLAGLKGLRRLAMHEKEGGDTAAVRAALEGAAPWLEAITLGTTQHTDEMQHDGEVVVWGDPWEPISEELLFD